MPSAWINRPVRYLPELAALKGISEERLLTSIRGTVAIACNYQIRARGDGLLYAVCRCPEQPMRPGQFFRPSCRADLVEVCEVTHRDVMVRRAVVILYQAHIQRIRDGRLAAPGYQAEAGSGGD